MTTAEYGDVLVSGVHLSQFQSICESWDEHGLSFTSDEGSQRTADPIGSIILTKDPSLPHEVAHSAVLAILWKQLIMAGLDQYFVICGSQTLPFGQGKCKEADASLTYMRKCISTQLAYVVVKQSTSYSLDQCRCLSLLKVGDPIITCFLYTRTSCTNTARMIAGHKVPILVVEVACSQSTQSLQQVR